MPVPVVSVGNITVGGTGKTPLVIDIVERLQKLGAIPAVVTRGYQAPAGGMPDEAAVISRRLPGVACVIDADRFSGGERAMTGNGANVIVLDDGFQHRRLARDCDILAIDATCPFGFGSMLPRGLLREPIESLRRADLLVITRCDQVSSDELNELEAKLGSASDGLPIVRCHHSVRRFSDASGAPIDRADVGDRVFAVAGIGQPDSFARTLEDLGLEIAGRWWLPDHHPYTRADVDKIIESAGGAEAVVTTEKDAVKLAPLWAESARRLIVIGVDIDFDCGSATILDETLGDMLAKSK